jgi:hypothetical protein
MIIKSEDVNPFIKGYATKAIVCDVFGTDI